MDPGVMCFHPRNCFYVITQVLNTNHDQNSAPKYGPNFSLKVLTNLQLQDVDQSSASISPKNSAVTATFQHCPCKIINHPFQLDSSASAMAGVSLLVNDKDKHLNNAILV